MAGAVALEFRGRRVPAVGLGIALGAETVGVAVVIELLAHGEADELIDVEVAVPREAVIAIDADLIQRQRLGHGRVRGHGIRPLHHLHLRGDGVAVSRGIIADDEAAHLIFGTHGIDGGISLGHLGGIRGIEPSHLPVFALAVGIFHPHLIRQARGIAHGGLDGYGLNRYDGTILCRQRQRQPQKQGCEQHTEELLSLHSYRC